MSWLAERLAAGPRRPYAVEKLLPAAGLHPTDRKLTHRLAIALGMSRGWVLRCRTLGLTEAQADEWACRLVRNPRSVWPDWGEVVEPCCDSYECICPAVAAGRGGARQQYATLNVMDDTERVKWVRAYEAGASIADLAEQADCSPSTMRTELLAAGVTLRSPGRRASTRVPGAVRGHQLLPTYGTVPEDTGQ